MADRSRFLSGCAVCPVKSCTAMYRGSYCSAKRAWAGVDFDPKTNAEELVGMTEDELLEALAEYFASRTQPEIVAKEEAASFIEWLRMPRVAAAEEE